MAMRSSISFIIPYYDLPKELLLRAVGSILDARLDADMEIIVVDDGTPQSHAQKWLAEFDDNRILYCYQENAGLSEARNAGIRLASKEYIQFIDADDYFFPCTYRLIVDILNEKTPDIAISKFKKVASSGIEHIRPQKPRCESFESGAAFMAAHSFFGGAWSYVFKRRILAGLQFHPGIYHEDEDFTPRLLANAKTTITTGITTYAYYQRPHSIINTSNPATIAKRFADLRYILKRLKNSGKTAKDALTQTALLRRYEQLALSVIYSVLKNAPDFDFICAELKELHALGCYPLPRRHYSWKYNLFRLLTNKRWKLRIMRFLLKQQ